MIPSDITVELFGSMKALQQTCKYFLNSKINKHDSDIVIFYVTFAIMCKGVHI